MISASAVAGAILMMGTRGGVSVARAEYAAQAITTVAGDDVGLAVALAVTGSRESGFDADVGECRRVGQGGWGYFQLEESQWASVNCGSVVTQTRGAARALRAAGLTSDATTVARVFGRYIGARAVERHPEARERAALYWATKARVECRCCVP